MGGNEHAFRYSGGVLTDLGTTGGSTSRAYGVSDAGLIGGDASTFSSASKIAMLYSGGQMSSVTTFGGSSGSINYISSNGTAAGISRTAGDVMFRGFIRYNNGAVSQMPLLNVSDSANYCYAVNDGGYGVGISRTSGGRNVAFLAGPFATVSLDGRGAGDSAAFAINNATSVVVGSAAFGGTEHAASFITNTAPTDLGTFPGGGASRALGVNDSGVIVGYAVTASMEQRGFVIPDSGTGMLDLNTLISGSTTFIIEGADAINAAGQIAASGSVSGGFSHALLLTPVPAPTPIPAAPTISGKKSLKTSTASIKVKGTAAGVVTSVTYKVGSKKGTASGTTSWSFKATKLKVGKNTATVIAHGPGGDSAPLKITITRK